MKFKLNVQELEKRENPDGGPLPYDPSTAPLDPNPYLPPSVPSVPQNPGVPDTGPVPPRPSGPG